ncbi:endonuclease/exonuclease/phosphatase family protein [Dactylosporangium sp. NPDC005572]|uniref:endonuclease/exonuclease/phosphatase family protein n=1 Tax=Dactylosporangium sp. NPDC005572 TaxID=3156889 RepID=UPI0033AB3AC1
MRKLWALVTVALLLLPAAPAAASATTRLRVMTLNIFYGGDDLDLSTGDFCAEPDGCPGTLRELERLIRDARADVVGVQEPERNVERIAADLGWYGSNRAHVMSRFPLIDPPGSNGLYVFVQVAPGRVVAVANAHLPSDPYGPYLVRDGGTRAEVLDLEQQVRVPAVRDLVRVLPALARQGIPVLLTGDFNSPSHLDWTPAVAKVRPEVRYPVRWPASAALAGAGLVDTFREAHPDPVRDPGFTWTPGSPESDPHEVHDRIDWVLRAGPSRTIASEVVAAGRSPYPTDHRGVVSTVEVDAAVPQVLVAPQTRRVTIGQSLPVTYHGSGRVTLRDDRGRLVAAEATRRPDGTVTFPTRGLHRGRYTVALGASRADVWLYPPGEGTTLRVDPRPGAVRVSFTGAPGMGLDWISLYACGSGNDEYLAYAYTGSAIEGTVAIGTGPLDPGCYVARLLPDDGYRSVAESAEFRILP